MNQWWVVVPKSLMAVCVLKSLPFFGKKANAISSRKYETLEWESLERERERESFEIAQYKNGEDQALQRFSFNRDPSRSPWGNRTATVWGVCHVAASTWEIKTGQCEARKGERTRGRWVMSDEDVWDVDKWTCQVALLSVRVEEDMYCLCMAQKAMWHYNRGLVLCAPINFSHHCGNFFTFEKSAACTFWFFYIPISNRAIGNVEGKQWSNIKKKKKKKFMW